MSCFTRCQTFHDKPTMHPEEEYPFSEIEDEQEVLILVIQARAMEAKLRRKGRLMTKNLHLDLFSTIGLFIPQNGEQHKEDSKAVENEEREAFFSAGSCFSHCSRGSEEAFFDVGSSLSLCSSASRNELGDVRRNSMFPDLSQCKGWPFGLFWKAMLLPPLPRSPSESWSWCRSTRIVKMP